jgi:uncharacterized UBP type Zn finger protein
MLLRAHLERGPGGAGPGGDMLNAAHVAHGGLEPMAPSHREAADCPHVPEMFAFPGAEACEGCGSRVDLRVCGECGFVGCCESQWGHDRVHALAQGHPVIRSLPANRHSFTWCYGCRCYV